MENYDLRKDGDQWKLHKSDADDEVKRFNTRAEGLEYSQEYLRRNGGQLHILEENGELQEERTFPKRVDPDRVAL